MWQSTTARQVLVAVLFGLASSGAAIAEEITLKYAFFAPAGTFPGKQMQYWAEQIEARTGGKVKVDTYPGGTLLNAREMYDGVSMGIVDIGLSAPSYDPGRFPLTSGMALPLGFADATTASDILWQVTQEFDPEEFKDFEVIAMFTSEPGYIMSREPIRNSDDLEGLRLRATGSGVPVLNALGGSAVGMPMPEVPQAVQTGVIDGAMTSREILQDFQLAESLKFVTDYPLVVSTFAAVMDKKRFAKLPEDVQIAIRELADEIPEWTGRYHDQENVKKALAWSRDKHGLQTIELDAAVIENWNALLKPVIEEWIAAANARGLPGTQYIERIRELQQEQ